MTINLLSKQDIENRLYQIAEDANITSESIEILVKLSTESIFTNQALALNNIINSNAFTTKDIRDQFLISSRYNYSIYRGNNAKLRVDNLKNTEVIEVKQFDQATEILGQKLFYAFDYTIKDFINDRVFLEFFVSNEVQEQIIIIDETNINNVIFEDIKNISEDINIFYNDSSVSFTRSYTKFLDLDIYNSDQLIFWVLTSEDYGITLVPNRKLVLGDVIKLIGTTYSTEEFLLSKFKDIPGFTIDPTIADTSLEEQSTLSNTVQREEDVDIIQKNILSTFQSSYILRTNRNIKDLILQESIPYNIADINVVKDIGSDVLICYYTTVNHSGLINISDEGELAVRIMEQLKFSQYIRDTLTFVEASPTIEFNLNLQVHYDGISPAPIIDQIIKEFSYSMGDQKYLSIIYSSIQKIENVIRVTPVHDYGIQGVQLKQDEYFNIVPNISYSTI